MSGGISTAGWIAIGLTTAATAASIGMQVAAGSGGGPKLPTPQFPAMAAPPTRNDTGAQVHLGTDTVANQRVSGRSSSEVVQTQGDVLGGLGRGGLSI